MVTAVHSAAYVKAVRTRSERRGSLDGETELSPGSYAAALHAAGGACAMVDALLAGEARAGFCGTRPPGHHARTDTTSGFCVFNNVAVAAQHALDALGARRVFIFDWDVHHGDGTNDVFRTSNAVLFASIHQSGIFPGTGQLQDVGSRARASRSTYPVPAGVGRGHLDLAAGARRRGGALEFRPDVVLVSGYDGHRDDVQGGCELEAGDYAEMARHLRTLGEAVGAPVGVVLEGGYALGPLAESVRPRFEALAGDQPPDLVAPDFLTSRAASHIGHHWTL